MIPSAFDDIDPAAAPGRPWGSVVRPRDAATLIIVDLCPDETPRVLMGRRNAGHDFMPGKWVFPGGRIDPSDFRAPQASELRALTAERLCKTTSPARAQALAKTAIRETFEEVGLLLAQPAPARAAAGPWREFLGQGALPDLDALEFVARAVTPAMSPKRFDARFFMASADRLISREPKPDCGELDEIAWFGLDDALKLDLPSVTRFILHEIPQRLADPGRPAPSLRFARGRQQLTHL